MPATVENLKPARRNESVPEETPGTTRMSLDLTPQMKTVIDNLAASSGRSRAEVLRQAIALFKVVKDAEHKNESAALIDDQGKVVARLINI